MIRKKKDYSFLRMLALIGNQHVDLYFSLYDCREVFS